jgi:K+/H+ antiporter YhaU regulatory subunit KhtT
MDRLAVLASATPGLREVRLGPTSMWAGHRIADVPLREEFGVTVLAVSRAGRSFFNPGAKFQLFPGDHVILSGEKDALDRAMAYLARVDPERDAVEEDFAVEELPVNALPGWAGRTLSDLDLRARYGVSVLAVIRDERLEAPDPGRPLSENDRVVLAGARAGIERVRGGLVA